MIKYFILLIFLVPFFTTESKTKKETLNFGSGRVNITPDKPIHMSGYAGRKSVSTGVHDSLFACALYFTNSKSEILIITADVISFSNELRTEIKNEVNQKTGIHPNNIFLSCTHNHGGPVVKAYEKNVSETVEEYALDFQDKIVEIAVNASNSVVPVKIGYGSGTSKMNINRRAIFADGSVWLGRNLDGPCDHEVSVLKIEDIKGKLLSVLINWPCHGTASGQENLRITGDWPGITARYINETIGKDVIVAVTAGASGDINPIYGPNDNFREIQAVGVNVAKEVLNIIPEIQTYPVSTVNVRNKTLTLPGKKVGTGRYTHEIMEKGPDREVTLSICKLGNYVLAGISGEVMTEIGMNIKNSSPYEGTLVVTHCNGTSGYICTDQAFEEGGYETKVTRLWPGAEKIITQNVLDMIHEF